MHGKIIAITGASGALGKVVVEAAAAQGAKIAAIDHAPSNAAPSPDRTDIGGVDLTDATQAQQAIDAAAAHLGRLDALINIAGAFSFQTIADGDTATWERLYRINTLTALHASRAAIPHLVASGMGRIVNIGALGALQAGSGMGPYAASKSGVHKLTESRRGEEEFPKVPDTPANRRDMPDADFAAWVTPMELANVILFLASDQASAVTGALIPVKGRV